MHEPFAHPLHTHTHLDPEISGSQLLNRLEGDHYWTAKNVSYFDTYVTEAASMGTRRLYFSLMRFCRVLGHCNKRFKHVSEQLWTGHTPAVPLP